MQNFYSNVMDLIKQARRERKVTQVELASLLGIAQGSWSDYERGLSKISLEDCLTVFNYLGISLVRLEECRGQDRT